MNLLFELANLKYPDRIYDVIKGLQQLKGMRSITFERRARIFIDLANKEEYTVQTALEEAFK